MNTEIVEHIIYSLIELKKDIDRKKIPKNENLNKIVDIVKRILDIHKEQMVKDFHVYYLYVLQT